MNVFLKALVFAWFAVFAATCLAATSGPDAGQAAGSLQERLHTDAGDLADGVKPSTEVPVVLDPVTVMRLTVRFSPKIRRAFERKTAEEARYDFFISNREGLSYGFGVDFDYDRSHVGSDRSLEKTLGPGIFINKEFYNTSSVRLATGYSLSDSQDAHEADAFVKGTVSVPLFGSREALQRSSDRIYHETEVNDARLDYYRTIRWQIGRALEDFNYAQRTYERLTSRQEYVKDLQELLRVVSSLKGRDTSADQDKLRMTITSALASVNTVRDGFELERQNIKLSTGIPFDTPVKVSSAGFNPFEGESFEDLEQVALKTDEEIKTLHNSITTSQAELTLARKGKWDTSLSLSAKRSFAGNGDLEDQAGYVVSAGVSLMRIDKHISKSLENVALAKIREYRNAVMSRQREIHYDMLRAYTSMQMYTTELETREANLESYYQDYRKGIEQYTKGLITVDELIQRRDAILDEESAIRRAKRETAQSVVTLITSTGRYEEFLESPRAVPVKAESQAR